VLVVIGNDYGCAAITNEDADEFQYFSVMAMDSAFPIRPVQLCHQLKGWSCHWNFKLS